jgi:hypothetical protein
MLEQFIDTLSALEWLVSVDLCSSSIDMEPKEQFLPSFYIPLPVIPP